MTGILLPGNRPSRDSHGGNRAIHGAEDVIDQSPQAEIKLDCDESIEARAGTRLKHAFHALIDNAIRHNNLDTPTVTIICTQKDTSQLQIRIQDNGPELSMGDKKVITGRSTLSPLEHGSGLGLWLTRWIVESYHGTITVQT